MAVRPKKRYIAVRFPRALDRDDAKQGLAKLLGEELWEAARLTVLEGSVGIVRVPLEHASVVRTKLNGTWPTGGAVLTLGMSGTIRRAKAKYLPGSGSDADNNTAKKI